MRDEGLGISDLVMRAGYRQQLCTNSELAIAVKTVITILIHFFSVSLFI